MWRLYGELAFLMLMAFAVGAALAWGIARVTCRDERGIVFADDDADRDPARGEGQ